MSRYSILRGILSEEKTCTNCKHTFLGMCSQINYESYCKKCKDKSEWIAEKDTEYQMVVDDFRSSMLYGSKYWSPENDEH